jgi:DNA-directed RNA polymerase specialized sigma24 family protein
LKKDKSRKNIAEIISLEVSEKIILPQEDSNYDQVDAISFAKALLITLLKEDEKIRSICFMYYFDRMSFDEIAETEGMLLPDVMKKFEARNIFFMKYCDGKTLQEIAIIKRCSFQWINKQLKKFNEDVKKWQNTLLNKMKETQYVSALMLERYHSGTISKEERKFVEVELAKNDKLRSYYESLEGSDKILCSRYPLESQAKLVRSLDFPRKKRAGKKSILYLPKPNKSNDVMAIAFQIMQSPHRMVFAALIFLSVVLLCILLSRILSNFILEPGGIF